MHHPKIELCLSALFEGLCAPKAEVYFDRKSLVSRLLSHVEANPQQERGLGSSSGQHE